MVSTLIAKFEERQRQVILSLLMIAFSLLILYGYFLVASVFDTLMRKEFEKSASQIESKVSGIEAEYLRTAAEVGRVNAYDLGLIDAPPARFLSRTTPSEGLTLNR